MGKTQDASPLIAPIDTWDSRLGFAAKIAGAQIPTSDNRRPQNYPSLRSSLEMTLRVLDYLEQQRIRVYRLPSNLCPYATHPKHPEMAWSLQFSAAEDLIALVGERVAQLGVRLSFHPAQYTLLNSPDQGVVDRSIADLDWQCRLLDEMGCGPEAVVLLHVGGVYGDRPAARQRMLDAVEVLPEHIKRRFALENDDVSWPAANTLEICQAAGLPMIFDQHHHQGFNHGEPWEEMLAQALETWSPAVRPKIHLSSPRDPSARPGSRDFRAHADYIAPETWREVREAGRSLRAFDVMLEAKAKDLAVLRLRAEDDDEQVSCC